MTDGTKLFLKILIDGPMLIYAIAMIFGKKE